MLRGAAPFDNSVPAVYKIQALGAQDFYTPLALNCQKESASQHWRCIKTAQFPVRPKLIFCGDGGGSRTVKTLTDAIQTPTDAELTDADCKVLWPKRPGLGACKTMHACFHLRNSIVMP